MSKTAIASFRLEMFRVSAIGTLTTCTSAVPVSEYQSTSSVPVPVREAKYQSTRVGEWDGATWRAEPHRISPPHLTFLSCTALVVSNFLMFWVIFLFIFFFIFSHNITSPSQIPFLSCQDSCLCSCYLLRCFEKRIYIFLSTHFKIRKEFKSSRVHILRYEKNLHLLEYTF